jgi:hypothetical protein
MAVGTYSPNGDNLCSLAEELEDGTWTEVPSGNFVGTYDQNSLAGVSCTSTTDCVAAGYGGGEGVVQGWDGSAFSVVTSTPLLFGVSCVTTDNCIAVGHSAGEDSFTYAINGAAAAFPSISSFTPKKGKMGRTVTVTGSNLAGANDVTFGGVEAVITSDLTDSSTAQVPPDAKSAVIAVTTPGGTAISGAKFKVK